MVFNTMVPVSMVLIPQSQIFIKDDKYFHVFREMVFSLSMKFERILREFQNFGLIVTMFFNNASLYILSFTKF